MNNEHFKKLLLAKERELQLETARLEGEARSSAESEVRDSTDKATSSEAESESLKEATVASQTLTDVQDALVRIEDASFGKCIACGRQIETARLQAVPWTPYCLEDEEKLERAARVRHGGSTL